jgi:hypothetical protein
MPASSLARAAACRRVDVWKIVAWASLLVAGALYAVDPLDLLASRVVPLSFVADEPDPPAPAAIEINLISKNRQSVDQVGRAGIAN